ncbi:MAG: 1-acyl-sn-glycerol-3-phosphate acyltransferase [Novosphingobium sp.]|nr:1-acyl-sn-glycerol-3-phosphate acyltransferase [Novosphingobium sp.]
MPLDSRPWVASSPLDVARSVLFYLVFYLGSIPYVVGAAAAIPVAERLFQRIVTGWSAYHRFCARWLLGIRVRVEGAIPNGPVIIALRHESFFEAIDLPTLLDDPVIVAKAELLEIPLWGLAARRWGLIAVRREDGAKALRAMVAEARARTAAGRPLAIFPEGTRVAVGREAELQSGFAALYKLLGLPVVPVAIDSGRLYHRWFKRPGTVTYRFGETIPAGLPRAEIEARVKTAITALNRGSAREGGDLRQ